MKYKDLLEQTALRADIGDSLPPTYVMPELQNSDAYRQYRHLIALASALATKEQHMPTEKESAWGENQAVICYTKADEEILRTANEIMGVKSQALTKTPSHEAPNVNKTSPVRKFVELTESEKDNLGHDHGTIARTDLNPISAQILYKWCTDRNIECIRPENLHCTLLYSSQPVPHLSELHGYEIETDATITEWAILGSSALVLMLDCPVAKKAHEFMLSRGGTHDYKEFLPHLTINYNWNKPLPTELPNMRLKFNTIHVMGIDPNYSKE
jgi:hypothetical protein